MTDMINYNKKEQQIINKAFALANEMRKKRLEKEKRRIESMYNLSKSEYFIERENSYLDGVLELKRIYG